MDHDEIVITPTLTWLKKQINQCLHDITIASPFLNEAIWKFTDLLDAKVKRSFVTRINLRDFAFGASSLPTMFKLVQNGWNLYSLPHIHAKLYIFDNSTALVTSANSTFAGLTRNLECGIAVRNSKVIINMRKLLFEGLGSDSKPIKHSIKDLLSLNAPVNLYKEAIKRYEDQAMIDLLSEPDDYVISFYKKDEFMDAFTGWRKLTLEAIIQLSKPNFNLDELYRISAPLALKSYPSNVNWEAKLRQQLQILRDMGLIKFVSRGKYSCLFKFT